MGSINVLFSMILGIIVLSVLSPSRAVPIAESPTQGDRSNIEVDQLATVSGGMELMLRVAVNSLCTDSTSNCGDIQFPLGHKALCYVYDRYNDFTYHLLTTSPDDPLFATYSANQYIAWKNLNSTCSWVQYKTEGSLADCTLTEIAKSCNNYQIYEHFTDIRTNIDKYILKVNTDDESGREVKGVSTSVWLQTNLQQGPKSVSSVILTATDCTTNTDGEFIC